MTTVVILGLAHCGTTMVARCLEILGVPMAGGTRYKPDKWEDLGIIKALQDEHAFATIVETRNTRTWGFKYPGAWKFAPLLKKYLISPVYLAIYKDPVSVTLRRFGTITAHKLRNTIRQMEDSIDGIMESGLPVEFLSYKDAIAGPREFVERLADLAGVPVLIERLDAAESYIRPSQGKRE